jgi:hypothetical protein
MSSAARPRTLVHTGSLMVLWTGCGPSTPEEFAEAFRSSKDAGRVGDFSTADPAVLDAMVRGALMAANEPAVRFGRRVLVDARGAAALSAAASPSDGPFIVGLIEDHMAEEAELAALKLLKSCCENEFANFVAQTTQDAASTAGRPASIGDVLRIELVHLARSHQVGAELSIGPVLGSLVKAAEAELAGLSEAGVWTRSTIPSTSSIVSWDLPEGGQAGSRDVPRPEPMLASYPSAVGVCTRLEALEVLPAGAVLEDPSTPRLLEVCADPRRGPEAMQVAAGFCSFVAPDNQDCAALESVGSRWLTTGDALQTAIVRVFDLRGELGAVKAEMSILEGNIRKIKDEEGNYYLEGVIVGQLDPQQYEVARYWGGDHLILETTVTEFSSTGRFGLWVTKMPPTEVEMTSGFTKWIDVVSENTPIAVGKEALKLKRQQVDELARTQREARSELKSAVAAYDAAAPRLRHATGR